LSSNAECLDLGGRSQRRDRHRTRQCHRLVAQHHQPLDAAGPADAGRRRSAKLGNQPVVSSAAQHGTLRAQMRGDEFESGVGVVIEAAHQRRIDLERHAGRRKAVLHRLEEILTGLVEVIGKARGLGIDRLVALVLAVEDAQGIALQAVTRLLGQSGGVCRIIIDQHLAIDRPAFRIAERVQLEHAAVEDAQAIKDVGRDRDHLDVGARLRRAQHLEIDLVELALAARLRPLVAEHRARREDLERQMLPEFAVRHEGAADAGGVFRSQGQRFVAAILEGVHLLGDHVGRLADAAREQLGELEDGRGHLAIAVEARHVARRFDDMGEAPVLVGKEIVRATHGLHLAQRKSLSKISVEREKERRYSAATLCRSASALAASISAAFFSISPTR
jgi:hypothetical protein